MEILWTVLPPQGTFGYAPRKTYRFYQCTGSGLLSWGSPQNRFDMEPLKDKDRRQSSRETMTQSLGFRPIGMVPGELMDISSHGAAITSLISVPKGTPIQLSLLGNSLSVNGTVKNFAKLDAGGYRLGLAFHQAHSGLPELLQKANRFQE